MELTVGITGASGTIYAHRTLQLLAASGAVETINLIMSSTAATVAQVEMGVNLRDADAAKINEWLGLARRFETHPVLASGQSRGEAFVGLEQAGRDDHRAVLDGHARCDRVRSGDESDPPCRRCLSERGTKTLAGPARDAVQRDPSREHAQACRTPEPRFCPQVPAFITARRRSTNSSSISAIAYSTSSIFRTRRRASGRGRRYNESGKKGSTRIRRESDRLPSWIARGGSPLRLSTGVVDQHNI